MAEIRDWTTLKCECGSEQFLAVMHLRFKEGGGTTPQPSGYMCAQCHTIADAAYLIGRVTLARKRREVAELQEEIAQTATAPAARGPSGGAAAPR